MTVFFQLLAEGIFNGAILALVAFSFALVYYITRIFHVAHAGIFTLSSYLVWLGVENGLPVIVAILAAVLICGFVGSQIYLQLYERLISRRASTPVMMIASLALLVVIENLIALFFTSDTLHYTADIPSWNMKLGTVVLSDTHVYTVFAAFFCLVIVTQILRRTAFGRRVRAVASNRFLAAIQRVNPRSVITWVYFIASVIVAVPSALISFDYGIRPYNGFYYLLLAAIAMIAGGGGNMAGAFIIAFAIGILQSTLILVIPQEWILSILFLAFVMMMIFMPSGLIGNKGS